MYGVLFAPSRGKYSDEEKPKVECLFCAIRDNDPRVWTREIYRDDKALIIMNIYPYSPGHIQVIPLRHVEDLGKLPENGMLHLLDFVQRGVELTEKVMNPDGWNLGINLSKSGASIPHLHVQIVPRYKGKVEEDQEKIHDWYLEEADIFEGEQVFGEEESGACKCFSKRDYVLQENPYVYLSENPYNRGHIIMSPAKHVSDPREFTAREFLELFDVVTKAKTAIENVYEPVGINIGINVGDVPNSSDHLQVHVVPRFDPESGFMEVVGDSRVVIESLDQTYEKLKPSFS